MAGKNEKSTVVGVVVIGRNEGDRLEQSLRSVTGSVEHLVFVDSGSSDGSPERAGAMGIPVVRLKNGPYTAARGRQVGLEFLLDRDASIRYVQFLDGDCVMDDQWLGTAVAYMDKHPDVGGISGRRLEARCESSFFSRLLDIDWDALAGPAPSVGGDSFLRVDAMRQVGGWATSLIAGEDPDISFRMRDRGWRIARLPELMTQHDARMTRFGQYWRRAVRSGHAYAEVGWKHRRGAGTLWIRRTVGILAYGAALPLVGVVSIPLFWPVAALIGLIYLRMLAVMVISCRRRARPWGLAMQYALLNAACKPANAIGVFQYWLRRAAGREARLIEYRGKTQPDSDLEANPSG